MTIVGFLVAGGIVALPAAAHGAFPGTPGKVAFTSNRDGDNDIYVVNPDGSGILNLTGDEPNGENDISPVWSPDGSRIAWSSSRDNPGQGGEELDLWVMNADGSGKVNLTPEPGVVDSILERNPAFSPDGMRIAFTSVDAVGGGVDIAVVNTDGTGLQSLTGGDGREEQGPAFSADGRSIYFSDLTAGNQISRMNADGSGRAQLTSLAGNAVLPDVSPDGRTVVFTYVDGGSAEVDAYVIDADGGNLRALAVPGDQHASAYSPDGQRLVFGTDFGPAGDIATMGADGTGPTLLASGPASLPDWQAIPYSSGQAIPNSSGQAIPYSCRGRRATIVGSFGSDTLIGTPGDDVIVGLPGRDVIRGAGGRDRICAGAGKDRVFGGKGNDALVGGVGRDALFGGPGNDRIFGGTPGAKKRKGGREVNVCKGGPGRDKLSKNCREDG